MERPRILRTAKDVENMRQL
ncbi:hypothetical protein Trydic_g12729, partial [Trypoxylus dichotomus]